MLSGDIERVAAATSQEVGLTENGASLRPDEKVTAMKEYLNQFGQGGHHGGHH